jgi:carbamoyltransferase
MRILGIHAIGHDTGAALIEDGRVVHSIETERLTRRRFDHRVGKAIDFILRQPGCGLETIDAVALSTPIGHDEVQVADVDAVMATLRGKVRTHVETTCQIRGRSLPCVVITHEASHAMLAVHYAGYRDRCLVLVNEGQGQFSQNALFVYQDGELTWRETDPLPWFGRGLGWTGMGVLFGMGNGPGVAGKLMAMGGYGRPDPRTEARLREIRDEVTTDRGYAASVSEQLHGEGFLGDFDRRATIIATFQQMFSESVVELVTSRMARYACDHVALGGGCGLNIVTNTALRDDHGIQPYLAPACNDSGHPLGAAAYAHLVMTGQPLHPFPIYVTGTEETNDELADALKAAGLAPQPVDLDRVVQVLAGGGVVGLLRGRAESGPRTLGHRSLLGNPDTPGMRELISERLKSR